MNGYPAVGWAMGQSSILSRSLQISSRRKEACCCPTYEIVAELLMGRHSVHLAGAFLTIS